VIDSQPQLSEAGGNSVLNSMHCATFHQVQHSVSAVLPELLPV
jgi:hypothetical protein